MATNINKKTLEIKHSRFVVFAQFVFLCRLPLCRCCFREIRVIRG